MNFITFNEDKLSKLVLGTVQFGLDYGIANINGKPTQENVNNIVKYLYEEKLNCFDTAQVYGNSEEVLGIALENTKSTFVISKLKSDTFITNAIGSVSNSLNNLGIKTLYGLLLHDSTVLQNWGDESSFIVDNLVEKNLIRYFGVSIYTENDFELAINNDRIDFIQVPFNLFDQRAIRNSWFKRAKVKNKLIFIRSVFLQGLLLMDISSVPKKLESAKLHLEQLEILCSKFKMTKNELALAYVDSIAKNSLILFGCDNIIQAKENIKNYNSLKKLTITDLNIIEEKFKSIEESIYNPAKW